MIFLFAAMCAVECFGIAASQAWVTNYVAQAIASVSPRTSESNGCVVVETTANGKTVRMVWENPTDNALMATNCTAAATAQSITNGTLFVWNGAGSYVNPNGAIAATQTNLVFSGVGSIATNGIERFVGWFDAKGVLIQPSMSFAITNIAEVAK